MKTQIKIQFSADGKLFDTEGEAILYLGLLAASKHESFYHYIASDQIALLVKTYAMILQKEAEDETNGTSQADNSSSAEPQHTSVWATENGQDPASGDSR